MTESITEIQIYQCDDLNQAKKSDELAAVQRDIAAREFLEDEMPLCKIGQ